MQAKWEVQSGQTTAEASVANVLHGERHSIACEVQFTFDDNRVLTEVQSMLSTRYFSAMDARIVNNTVYFSGSFKGFTRVHVIDLAVITKTPTGTRGGARVQCILNVEALPQEPPPETIIPSDAHEFFLSADAKYIHTPPDTHAIALVFEDLKYQKRMHSVQHVSIHQVYPELDRDDPYSGPKILRSEILNDGSGIAVWFDRLRVRHNYRLAIDTDVTSMRNLYLSTK